MVSGLKKDIALVATMCFLIICSFWWILPSPIALAVVSGSSMKPAIRSGSLVIGVPRKPLVGDIVIARIGGNYVIHRVVNISGDIVYTKGDNNNYTDPPVRIQDVRYVVVLVIPPAIASYVLSSIIIYIAWTGTYFTYKYAFPRPRR